MYRYTFVLLAGLCTTAPAVAATWADALFEELSKDFGSVPRGPTLSHPFRLKNNTKNDVAISGVRVGCPVCSSASVSKSTLKPGEESAVVVNMFTTRFSGVKSITIYVQFSQPQFEEVRLVVQANSRDDVGVTPDTIAFGRIKRGSSPSADTTITFMGIPKAQILEAKCDSNYVQATATKVDKSGDNEVKYKLTAKMRGDTPVGKWYTDIWVKTNITGMERVRVPLTVEIEATLSLSPAAAALGEVKVGGQVERKILLRGSKPFRVTSIRGADDQISVKDSTTDSKPVHVLTVTLKGVKAGDVNRTLRILTDLKEDGEIELSAKGKVVP
jgi:hypothetical protein